MLPLSGGTLNGDLDVAGSVTVDGLVVDGATDLTGNLGVTGDVTVSGGVVFGTGGPSPITSNTLDDYEEGTWTPTVIDGTLTLSTLWSRKYTKIGNLVTIQCFIALNDDGSGGVNAVIGGLPFTVLGDAYGTGVLSHSTGSDTTSTMYVRAEATYNRLLVYKGSATQVRQDQIDGGWIIFTVSYHTS
tara:strand:- start:14 stop:574 length:561 start_codon:yes stop_codon:yes gene_type:complete